MKSRLGLKENIIVASTLFGMFFGAGNLIFPVHLGQMAGSNVWPAIIGFVLTAVTIPIMGVAALGSTHSDNVLVLSSKVSKWYGYVYTCALALTIGPFFAIPRCATTSFVTGVEPMLGEGGSVAIAQLIFTFVFFALVLFFSLRPNGIMTWIGRIINPIFLVFLAILVITALVHPSASISEVQPVEAYASGSFFNGFIEGYGTMDAIAALLFGVVIIDNIRSLGVRDDNDVANCTLRAGIYTALLMALIYVLTIIMGTQSRGLFEVSDNGGIALAQISGHYLGKAGSIILAITITLACLKTAIGLVTSCSRMFTQMFETKHGYKFWAIAFTVFAFLISNVGLTKIIEYSLPVLMLLYPLTVVLIILSLFDKKFESSHRVYIWTTIGAALPAICDFIKTLPFGIDVSFASKIFPLYDLGFGWIVPALIGFIIGMIRHKISYSRFTEMMLDSDKQADEKKEE